MLFKELITLPKIACYFILFHLLSPRKEKRPILSSLKKRLASYAPGHQRAALLLVITGKVSRVGYAGWLRRKARGLGLDHGVLPKGEGVVEALLVGPPDTLEKMIPIAWKGPKKALVQRVEASYIKYNSNEPPSIENKREEPIPWSKKTAEYIEKALQTLGPIMDKANSYKEKSYEEHSNAMEIYRAAKKRNLFVLKDRKSIYILSPTERAGLQNAHSSNVSSLLRSLTTDKHLTKEYLSSFGLPTPKGQVFTELLMAREYLMETSLPLVVKPVSGSYGRGITVDVRGEEALVEAWNYAKEHHHQILLEEHVEGVDIRVLVIGGEAKAALLRVPAHVVGDGESAVEELIHKKNEERMKNARLCKAPIIMNDYMKKYLSRQHHSLLSIPAKGELVFLHLKANIGAGADSVGITESIHPDLLRLAEEAAEALGIVDFLGVDLLVEEIHKPRNEQRCAIIEVNTKANIMNVQFPLYGAPIHGAKALIHYLFPEEIEDDSYPLEEISLLFKGIVDESFAHWFHQEAEREGVKGKLEIKGHGGEATLKGRLHHLLFFLHGLWEYKGKGGQRIYHLEICKQEERVYSHTVEPAYGSRGCRRDSAHDPTTELFLLGWKERGYEAQLLNSDLIELKRRDQIGITGMVFSNLFCDSVWNRIEPGRKILALSGLPIPSGGLFKTRERREAQTIIERIGRPCILTSFSSNGIQSSIIEGRRDLFSAWKRARGEGASSLLLEEIVEGCSICVAIVAGRAAGAMMIEPAQSIGDGELLSCVENLHLGFYQEAVKSVEAFAGLELAFVYMTIPLPHLSPYAQRWVVNRVDTRPKIGAFHYPLKGRPILLVDRVIEDLGLVYAKWMKC